MRVELRPAPFDAVAEVMGHRAAAGNPGKSGAASIFIGTMRDFNEGQEVGAMTLEHYPGMTEKHLQGICAQAAAQWAVHDILVLHRTGDIEVGEDIVLIATWAAHRGDAIDATRCIIEDLKHKAPFWKKEVVSGGERWVERNTTGYLSAD
ncbi:MAG: molybdenum cofactor biosynthesis protein MoaE [Gammaproteobacteria bacterium]|nr:molybdenum cofactor biosynthesis protein MoaE [Gammaproteobacteria bacterium]MCY4283047.1 molybdenum cofactor biosynthesis protein MoaE [Gammaproteobacteria bacterium]MCY4339268.1 molybdenum cofactor biosynthesis protein MoaE [Gammaproteobacteria bacterium]